MLVCGINCSPEKMAKGENNNCRVYEVRNNECVYLELSISRDLTSTLLYIRLILLTALGTLDAKETEDYQVGAISRYAILYSLIIYQRVTVLSPDGGYLAAAGAHDVSELSLMNFTHLIPAYSCPSLHSQPLRQLQLVLNRVKSTTFHFLPPMCVVRAFILHSAHETYPFTGHCHNNHQPTCVFTFRRRRCHV